MERQNAVVIDKLAAFVHDSESWDEGLQNTVFGINTDVHSATNFSPFQVLFGFPARIPVETGFFGLKIATRKLGETTSGAKNKGVLKRNRRPNATEKELRR